MRTQPRRIGLVAAPRAHRGGILRARDQYDVSPVFRRAAAFCEREYDEWYILSTAHHLLRPQQVIGPEEPAFAALPAEERAQWAAQAADQLRERASRTAQAPIFVLYASQRWADALCRAAPELTIELPLSGMNMSDRLQWYAERLRTHRRVLGN